MKFEKSRLKSDEGYFADCLIELKEIVESEEKRFYGKIVHIDTDSESDDCFKSDIDNIYRFYFYKIKSIDLLK